MFFSTKGFVSYKPCKIEATISINYYRDFVVAAVSSFHKKAIPNIGMHSNKSLHDSATSLHVDAFTRIVSTENNKTWPHSAYIPDLALCGFSCSYNKRDALREKKNQCSISPQICHIPASVPASVTCNQKWPQRTTSVVGRTTK